jgi:hypothetical protein
MKRIGKLAATLVFNSAAILALIALVTSAFAQQPAMGAVALGSATLPPGAMINAANVQNYTRFLPPGADVFVQHGLTIRVVPSKRLDWSAGFTAETEKYSGQVGLDKDDYITNYVAGMPFPTVDINDPKAAVKIAYNWHMGPFMPDDFSQEPWGSFAYSTTGSPNGIVQEEWADYTCTHFVFLRYAHRTEVDPRPSLVANDDGVEWKARCLHWKGGPDMSPSTDTSVTGFVVRYLDPRKPDREVFFKGGSQKYRGGYVSDERCRACHQPYWAYALPKTEEYSYRLLGTTLVLGCLTADHEPAGIVEHQGALALSEEPFQLRNAYVLEMAPRADEKLRTLVYIDAEAYVWLGAKFFLGQEQTEAAFPLWRSRPAPSGGYLFDLAGEFYVPFGKLAAEHPASVHLTTLPKLFFRSLAPAHGRFLQKINAGAVSQDLFDPYMLDKGE